MMAKIDRATYAHPKAFDSDVPRALDELQRANDMRHDAALRGAFVELGWRLIAAMAALGALFLFTGAPGCVHESDDVAASASTSAPATPVSNVETQRGNGSTGYFPDQFTVKQWDESPLPPQF